MHEAVERRIVRRAQSFKKGLHELTRQLVGKQDRKRDAQQHSPAVFPEFADNEVKEHNKEGSPRLCTRDPRHDSIKPWCIQTVQEEKRVAIEFKQALHDVSTLCWIWRVMIKFRTNVTFQ